MDFGAFLRKKERARLLTGGITDLYDAGSSNRFQDLNQRFQDNRPINRASRSAYGVNRDNSGYQEFPPTLTEYREGDSYKQSQRFPRHRPTRHPSRGLQPVGRGKTNSMSQNRGRPNQRRGHGFWKHPTWVSRDGKELDQTGTEDMPQQDDTVAQQDTQEQGDEADNNNAENPSSAVVDAVDNSEEALQEKDADTEKKEGVEVKQDNKDNNDEADDDDEDESEDDETTQAIKKLPHQHARGLMSTLIGLAGPDIANKPPDPVPPPRPMKLEDDVAKYLGPGKQTTTTSVSKTAFLESGITPSMLAEANMELDHDGRDLMPEDIGRETDKLEFYCKLCQKQTTSLGNFRDHLNGKGHKAVLEAVKLGKKPPAKGKKKGGKALSEVGQKSVCLETVEGTKEPVLGLSCVTEYHSPTGVVCVCNLCAVKFDHNVVVSHVTGAKHRLRYMRDKKPAVYVHLKKFGGKKSQLTSFLNDLSFETEIQDGRGIPVIKVYHPEKKMDDRDRGFGRDNHNRFNEPRLRSVDQKEFAALDFQDWVNEEVKRSKELYDSRKRSPSPSKLMDYNKPMEPFRPGRNMSPERRDRAFSRENFDPNLSHHPPGPPMYPHFPTPQPFPPPMNPFAPNLYHGPLYQSGISNFGPPNVMPERLDTFIPRPELHNHSMLESQFNPLHNLDPDPVKRLASASKSTVLIDYGHASRDMDKNTDWPSKPSGRSTEDRREDDFDRGSRNRDKNIDRPSRPSARSIEDRREDDYDRVSRNRDKNTDRSSRPSARSMEDRRDYDYDHGSRNRDKNTDHPPRSSARSKADRREDDYDHGSRNKDKNADRFSRPSARSMADRRVDDYGGGSRSKDKNTDRPSRPSVRNTADKLEDDYGSAGRSKDKNTDHPSRPSARSTADRWEDDYGSGNRNKGKNADRPSRPSARSTADKWEDDIQRILGHSSKQGVPDSLALLSSTYSSPEKSPSPPKKIKPTKELPFSKSYVEMLESQKRQKDSNRNQEFLKPEPPDSRRNAGKLETSFRYPKMLTEEEPGPKFSRSPDVSRPRHRSPEHYGHGESRSPHTVSLKRKHVPESPDHMKPVFSRQRSRSPQDMSSPRATAMSDTDAEAERIASLLLEISSTLTGREDPQSALKALFSNKNLTSALLAAKDKSEGGKSQSDRRSAAEAEQSSGYYGNTERPTRYVGSPERPGRYTVRNSRSPEKPSRYAKSPEKSARNAGRYDEVSPERLEQAAYLGGNRAIGGSSRPAPPRSREKVAFSFSGFNRGGGTGHRSNLPMTFADD